MGVFARFRRKSKDTEEASTTEAAVGTPTAEPEAAEESPDAETGKEEAKAESIEDDTEAEAKTDAKADAEVDDKADTKDKAESTEAAAAENVEIPKQQSAEKAADNDEADEGARK
ncbi:hypothetical protein ACGFSB_27930 [Streptomyces sp. NPDC048441]|uniref:hypothetical protein n=1 Tax=Streptomyces sp. NPDC048441 TaxID=3365552 RepID=UPI00371BB8BF